MMFKDGSTWHYVSLCQTLGYQFKNKRFLIQALTRRSSILEGIQDASVKDYQRLEYLGDKVIGLVISDFLFEMNPNWNEGDLTIGTSDLVRNNGPLIAVAEILNLSHYLITGNGEKYLVESHHEKILSDHVEAIFGAIFLDCGKNYKIIRNLIIKHWTAAGLIHNNTKQTPTSSEIPTPGEKPTAIEIARVLEKYGTSTDTKVKIDKFGNDQLDEALLYLVEFCTTEEEEKDLRTLLMAGANPNSIKTLYEEYEIGDEACIGDRYTRSALQLAVMSDTPSLVAINLLLEFGADPNWNETTHTKDTGPIFMQSPSDIIKCKSHTTETKLTALHLIATRNYCGENNEDLAYQVVKLLLTKKANPLKTDCHGNTPFTIRANNIERLNREYEMHYSSVAREMLCGEISEAENKQLTKLLREATYGLPKTIDPNELRRGLLIELSGVLDTMTL